MIQNLWSYTEGQAFHPVDTGTKLRQPIGYEVDRPIFVDPKKISPLGKLTNRGNNLSDQFTPLAEPVVLTESQKWIEFKRLPRSRNSTTAMRNRQAAELGKESLGCFMNGKAIIR